MSGQIVQEAVFWVHALLLGILLMQAYDLLRIFRRVVRHRRVWVGLEDFFYWICSAFLIFRLLYTFNYGVIRWFAVGGVCLGMVLYRATISERLVRQATQFLKFLGRVCGRPARRLFCYISRKFQKAAGSVKKVTGFLKKRLKKREKESRINLSRKSKEIDRWQDGAEEKADDI